MKNKTMESIGEEPGENIMAGFLHFRDKHPDLYKILVGRLKRTACMEDHDGMVRRHGGGALKVQCGRCRKILYKPQRKVSESLLATMLRRILAVGVTRSEVPSLQVAQTADQTF